MRKKEKAGIGRKNRCGRKEGTGNGRRESTGNKEMKEYVTER